MVRRASLFSHLVALFHRGYFFDLVFRHQTERYAKGFGRWDHFVAMLFCQMAGPGKLRFRFRNKRLSLDSSTILGSHQFLCAPLQTW